MKPPRPRIPNRLGDALEPLNRGRILDAADVAVARALSDADTPTGVIQAIALVSIARRLAHTCVDLDGVDRLLETAAADHTAGEDDPAAAPGPAIDPDQLHTSLVESPLVERASDGDPLTLDRPLVFDPSRRRLWFARYASYEQRLADALIERSRSPGSLATPAEVDRAVTAAFGGAAPEADPQRDAVARALTRSVSFIIGGPGTGKTWTVGRLVDAAESLGVSGRDTVAIAAPTGKAAERLTEAVGGALEATTIHRLLGMRPGVVEWDENTPVPHRLVIVDEASMIDLAMMTRLVTSVRADAHLVFVGDPAQLVSIEVGSVLRDLIDAAGLDASPLADVVTTLATVHRQAEQSPILPLADAIHAGNADRVITMLDDAAEPVIRRVEPSDTGEPHDRAVTAAQAVVAAAETGNATGAATAAKAVRVLAAVRRGPTSLDEWSRRIRQAVGFREGEWRPGRPLLVTRNDAANGVYNGDTGVVVPDPDGATALKVAFVSGTGTRYLPPDSLRDHEDWWAMTIHKSQGSEYGHVIVVLPDRTTPILTRELLYTAVTRAQESLTIVATRSTLRHAITTPIARSSGLVDRLRGEPVS